MSTKKNAIGRRKFLGMGAAAAGLGLLADLEAYPQNVNRNSIPSDLKITDMRIAVLRGTGGQAGPGGSGGVGAGFNPEFTGHDNVYLNGSILGLSTRQIDQRYKDIEDFAEIGEFIN